MTNERATALAAARNALAFLAMNQAEPITVEKIGGDAHVTLDRVVLRYQDYDDWSEIDYREFDSDTWRSVGDIDEMTDELQDEIHDAMTTIDAYAYHYGVDELNEAAAEHFIGCGCDETERDDIDVDTLDGMRCAAAMLASVVAAVRAEVAVRSAEFEEQHYGNADESLEAARCAGNLNALRWLESLVTAPIR